MEKEDSTKISVMISYSHQDSDLMLKIRDLLTENNFEVWVDTKLKGGSKFFESIGSAIIGCDIFLFLMTKDSVASKFCEDEVSLARISEKTMVPVTYCNFREVLAGMSPALRLILSSTQWVCLDSGLEDAENNETIVKSLNQALQTEMIEETLDALNVEDHVAEKAEDVVSKTRGLHREAPNHKYIQGFWTRHFGDKTKVELRKVLSHIKKDYKSEYEQLGLDDTKTLRALARWCFDLDNLAISVTRGHYDMFVFADGNLKGRIEGPDSFWTRCKEGFSMEVTMGQVFDAQSSVRYDSIKNLGQIKNRRFVNALYKLLKDEDPNIRAVACSSLPRISKTHSTTLERIEKLLKDPDRLVRESACVSLGMIRNPGSVTALLGTWRNDVISDVRNAALKSLQTIGTSEATEGIKVVKNLQEEIKKLGDKAPAVDT